MYSMTNVPIAASRHQIKAHVNGENIDIRHVEQPGTMGWGMSSLYLGDHMLTRPEELRQMVGDAIAFAITAGRDAGYRQAQADIRQSMGAKADDR